VFYLGLFNLMFPGFDLDFSKMLGVLSRG